MSTPPLERPSGSPGFVNRLLLPRKTHKDSPLQTVPHALHQVGALHTTRASERHFCPTDSAEDSHPRIQQYPPTVATITASFSSDVFQD